MSRKYTQDLLNKIVERQEVMNIKGVEVLVKNLPDSDEKVQWTHVFIKI